MAARSTILTAGVLQLLTLPSCLVQGEAGAGLSGLRANLGIEILDSSWGDERDRIDACGMSYSLLGGSAAGWRLSPEIGFAVSGGIDAGIVWDLRAGMFVPLWNMPILSLDDGTIQDMIWAYGGTPSPRFDWAYLP